METAKRRTLTFETLDRVMPEVDTLLKGYTPSGNWTLGQICNHVAFGIRGSVEGFPDRAPSWARKLIAPFVLRKVMREGKMAAGMKVPDEYLPKPALDDRAEAEALRATLALFRGHNGPWAEHPFFGPLSPELWTRLHCIHCAHHLSFLRPESGA